MAREIKQWITINGIHVPIYEGQSKGQAVSGFIKNASKFKDSKKKTLESRKVRTEKRDDNKKDLFGLNDAKWKSGDILNNKQSGEKLFKVEFTPKGESESITLGVYAKYPQDVDNYLVGRQMRGSWDRPKQANEDNLKQTAQIDKDEKTKQDQIKKNETERKQRNLEQIQKARDNRFAEDVEKARNGDLSARNDYMDRLNAINAKIGSGRGSAKLVEEASQLREKINKINDAYRESDKYKKEHADWKAFQKEQAAKRAEREEKSKSNPAITGSGKAVDAAKEDVEPKRGTAAWLKWMEGDKNSQVYSGTVNKVNINDKPSKQLLVRLNDLAKGDEPIGKFWDGDAELNSIYEQLQKAKDFSFTQAHKNLFHTYYRYYNDGDLPGWARGTFNEFSKGEYNKSWGYYTKLSERGELEFERRINAAIVNEYLRYKKKNK